MASGLQSRILLNSPITLTYQVPWKDSAHGLKAMNLTVLGNNINLVMSPKVIAIEVLFWLEHLSDAREKQHFYDVQVFLLILSTSGNTRIWDSSLEPI